MTLWAVSLAAAAAAFFAAAMLFSRSLYACAVFFLAVIAQLGVIFALLGAPLLGLLLVMIYAGAVMVLGVIAIMACGPGEGPRFSAFAFPRPLAWAGLALAAAEVVLAMAAKAIPAPAAASAAAPSSAALAGALFGPYAPALEAVTVLMLLASLAAVPEEAGA